MKCAKNRLSEVQGQKNIESHDIFMVQLFQILVKINIVLLCDPEV